MRRLVSAALTLTAAACGSIAATPQAGAAPQCQVNWELGSDGQCHPIYSVPINGYDPYGLSPESVGIQSAHICAWRAKGVTETDIVYEIVVANPGMITPNVEDWVREAEQNNCPQHLAELATGSTW